MKRLLSVLLALMMVVSTVSFAAPSVVNVTESATGTASENAAEEAADEVAELAEVHAEYGQLVYAVDFEQDTFDVDGFKVEYANLESKDIASYKDAAFDFSNVTTYSTAGGNGMENTTRVTEDGNSYIQGDVAAGYDGHFRMTKYNMDWPAGTYTFSVDVKTSVAQSWTVQCNDTKIAMTADVAFDASITDWQTVVFHTTNPVSGGVYDATSNPGTFYGFFMTPNNSTAGTVAYDNWKVYYKADTASVVIDPNGKSGNTAVTVEGLTANSTVSVATLVEKAKEMDSSVIGLAESSTGAMLNASSNVAVEYYERLYAVYGFDISIMANGNSDVNDMILTDIDTRVPYTVGELVAMFNSSATTDRILRGVSSTPKGEPLADSTVINTTQTLYLIWETDGSEYGTVLASIDFEDFAAGDVLVDNGLVELVDPDALTNGEFTINWQVGENKIAQEELGNKHVRGGQGYAQFLINNSKYNDASAPMPEGKYTILVNVIDFGTTKRGVKTACQSYQGVTSGTANEILDSFTGENNKWDLVVGQWQASSNDMSIYFTDNATTEVGFDNIKLYFEPASDAVFSITVDPNGRSGVSKQVAKVNNGSTITAGELAALMPGCVGVSKTVDGEALPSDYIVSPDYNRTYYAVWEYEESEFGTLLLDIDFERDGITFPTSTNYWYATDIATSWNEDLVYGDIYFNIGSSTSGGSLSNREFVTEENGNTYFKADATNGYNFISVLEYQNELEWLNGTYTYVMDVKTSVGLETHATHVNNYGTNVTSLDSARYNDPGKWDTIAIQYNGIVTEGTNTGSIYIAPKVAGGTIEVDNIRLYFKTDETVITLKPNGNKDITDIEVPVSTSAGITVAELIEEVNAYETTRTLLGISETPTGDLLAEDLRITPAYQQTLYTIWKSKTDNPMLDDYLGKLLIAVDFERQEVIDANWNGIAHELDNVLAASNSGGHVEDVATLYDPIFVGKNVRVRFNVLENAEGAEIKTSTDGENHYIEGVSNIRFPQVTINNFENVNMGNGIYTVFVDAMGTGTGSFAPHTAMAGYNPKKIDPETYNEVSAWNYIPKSWGSYAYSYQVTDGSIIPQSGAYFSFGATGATVAFDNYKLYYKPFTTTITLDPGDYPEFGMTTIENISTTGENTAQDLVDYIQADLDVCGREFVGLMDEYGEMLNLDAELVIPCEMTYTIVWGDMNDYSPEVVEKTAIRYSTKAESRGIRFAANANPAYALDTTKATEYGWVIARKDVLEEAGIRLTSLTKESFGGASNKVIVGKNYGFEGEGGGEDGRKHFEQDDENIIITAVIYGVPEKYYRYEFTVRPYMVYDGVTYYDKPFSRSIYGAAKALVDAGYPNCDEDLINYIDTIIANTPAE